MRPPSMMAIRLPSFIASSRSWLTNTMVFLSRACKSSNSSCNLPRIRGSSAENGSSISRISASVAKARARPTRCCMPPESSCAYLSAQLESPTIASFSSTIRARSGFGMPRSSRPNSTFWRTVRQGSNANCWNTVETVRMRNSRSTVGVHRVTSTRAPACSTSTLPRATLLSRLMARSTVDLPDPESPIRTQSSPRSTERLMPAAPNTQPVRANISSRAPPPSIILIAASILRPNTISTCWNSTAAI